LIEDVTNIKNNLLCTLVRNSDEHPLFDCDFTILYESHSKDPFRGGVRWLNIPHEGETGKLFRILNSISIYPSVELIFTSHKSFSIYYSCIAEDAHIKNKLDQAEISAIKKTIQLLSDGVGEFAVRNGLYVGLEQEMRLIAAIFPHSIDNSGSPCPHLHSHIIIPGLLRMQSRSIENNHFLHTYIPIPIAGICSQLVSVDDLHGIAIEGVPNEVVTAFTNGKESEISCESFDYARKSDFKFISYEQLFLPTKELTMIMHR
jgi:hypothetical protein